MKVQRILQLASVMVMTILAVSLSTSAQCLSANDDLNSIATYHDISGMINFDLNLFKDLYLHMGQHHNVFISPYSIWSSLLLIYMGSDGKTREQMEKVLGVNDKIKVFKTWKVLEHIYRSRQTAGNQNSFVLANRAFIHQKVIVNPCIVNMLHDELEVLDLSQNIAASARINQFISERTLGKISHLVQPSHMQRALAVLANAAAFKGTWHEQFDREKTSLQRFYSSPEEYSVVPMMNLKGNFKHGKSLELQAEVLELPYSDGHTSMYLLLPGLTTGPDLGLANLVVRLTPDKLRSSLTNMWHRDVNIQLPRFKLQNVLHNELKRSLFRLGLRDVFTNMANLTTLAPFGGLMVSESLHQANIEVDEEGTEASAATIFILTSRTRNPPPVAEFTCNRPFLFLIYDNFTGNILFIGTYRNGIN